ncbi:MAG: SAM-dependent methyltransferase [Chitinophagaceae bacterium]|nr:SAM-dependent methyltransferase [Chitinophagaceae bacterium]
MKSTVYLVPSLLHEDGLKTIPVYILDAVKDCHVFFVENERTARRYLKQLWKEMVIDDYEWVVIHKAEEIVKQNFIRYLNEGKNIGIISEAGCPAIADPGQMLVAEAQKHNAIVKPLVGPSSILLALMASGMNGQCFQFLGYLPIDKNNRVAAIRALEKDSQSANCTQLFIETPYRNNQMIESILQNCQPDTRLCIAVNLTGSDEWVKTKTIKDWSQQVPDIHKKPAMFLIYARR